MGWGRLGWDDEGVLSEEVARPTPELEEEPTGRPYGETTFWAESTAGVETGPSLGFQEGTKGLCAGVHRGRGA